MNKIELIWHYYCEFKQNSFFMEEYPYYISWLNKEEKRYRISSKGWDYINSKVFEAQQIYDLDDFTTKDLTEVIRHGMTDPWRWRTKSKYARWYKYYKNRHRQSQHYTKQPHHKKKDLSEKEIAKKDWREMKGIDRDKKKNGWHRRGAGKYFKKLSNQMHRSWERTMIYNEDYDNMHEIDYKFFLDPWMWD